MASVPDIANMKAKALVIMATRREDQGLISEVATEYGVDEDVPPSTAEHKDWRGVVPSYGWHPWFSHQIYDDTLQEDSYSSTSLSQEQKRQHYKAVLTPTPADTAFLEALPEPVRLSTLISDIRASLSQHPLALIGEVGLDRAFRIPEAWLPADAATRNDDITPGSREGRRLSPYRVTIEHQKKLLLAQLHLAGEMSRAASVHGVQAHGMLYETLKESWKGHEKEVLSKKERKKRERDAANEIDANTRHAQTENNHSTKPTSLPYPPRICLHSYSGPAEQVKQYLGPEVPAEIFFSFSLAINFSTSATAKSEEVIKLLPDELLLIESDMPVAGQRMDDQLEAIARTVCRLKEWELKQGVEQLKSNWMRFVFGRSSSGHA